MSTTQVQYIIDTNGNKTAAILSIEQYEQMLEDIHDLAIVAERRSEQAIDLAEIKKRLNPKTQWNSVSTQNLN